MKIRVVLEVDVDPDVWANEYHLDPSEVRADIIAHVPDVLTDAAQVRAGQLSTFTVALAGAVQVLGDGPGQVAVLR